VKTLITTLLLAMASAASADLGTPSSTVEAVIRQAQKGQIVGVNLKSLAQHKKHALTGESLLKLLQGIHPEKLVIRAKDKEHRIYWFTDTIDPNQSQVRLLEPRCLDFEVMFVRDESNACGGYYEVTSVHRWSH
jgi:hypothetical protein